MSVCPAWETLAAGPVMCVYPDTMATLEMDSVNRVRATHTEQVVQYAIQDQVIQLKAES